MTLFASQHRRGEEIAAPYLRNPRREVARLADLLEAEAGLWGVFAAPRSPRRLELAVRAPSELGVFTFAALALVDAGNPVAAIVFAAAAILNAVLLTALGQWHH